MPNCPQVSITHIITAHTVIMLFTHRRSRSIRCWFIIFSDFSFKNMIKEFFSPFNIFSHIHPSRMHIFNFVITVPNSKRRVIAKPFYIVFNFPFNIFKKSIIKKRISLTSKLKILPNKNTAFIASIVKFITFIISAAPNTNHIHIWKLNSIKHIIKLLLIKASNKAICRNIIGALNKERNTV